MTTILLKNKEKKLLSEYKPFCMCNIVHVYVNYANVLKGLQFPTPILSKFGPNN